MSQITFLRLQLLQRCRRPASWGWCRKQQLIGEENAFHPDSSTLCLSGFPTNEHLRHIADPDARNSSESMVIVLAPWEKLRSCADDFSKIGFIRTYLLTALVQSCTLFISKSRACHWNSWVKIWQAQRAADKHGKSNATSVAGKALGKIRNIYPNDEQQARKPVQTCSNMFETFCWRDVGGWELYGTNLCPPSQGAQEGARR